jgi:hypothetical protein
MIADMQKHEIATQHRFFFAFNFFFQKFGVQKKSPPPPPRKSTKQKLPSWEKTTKLEST